MIIKVSDCLFVGWIDVPSTNQLYSFSIATTSGELDLTTLRFEKRLAALFASRNTKLKLLDSMKGMTVSPNAIHSAIEGFVVNMHQTIPLPQTYTQTQTELTAGTREKTDLIIIKQIRDLGWEHITNFSRDLSEIQLKTVDRKQRCHYMTLIFNDSYPWKAPNAIQVCFPQGFEIDSSHKSKSNYYNLIGIKAQLDTATKMYEDFFDVIDELQELGPLLDSVLSPYAVTSRKVLIGTGGLYALIDIDPLRPKEVKIIMHFKIIICVR